MAKQVKIKSSKNSNIHLLIISVVVLTVKILISFSIPNHAWLGADGENYITQTQNLFQNGLFSEGLIYWPAGYALTIWILQIVTFSHSFLALVIFQSSLWSFSVYSFGKELYKTKLVKISIPLAYILLLNPTLTLTSMSIGYESICASATILSLSLLMRVSGEMGTLRLQSIAALLMGYASTLQPRLIPGYFLTLIIFRSNKNWKTKKILRGNALIVGILVLLPAILIGRNFVASGQPVLSTNLGVNMLMGAGEQSDGAYNSTESSLDCPNVKGSESVQDSAAAICALKWHIENPGASIQLALKKSVYFWSPWWGPLAKGTMARNPYLNFHPLKQLISNEQDAAVAFGFLGYAIAWVGMLLGLILLIFGFIRTLRIKGIEGKLALSAAVIIGCSWGVTILTFGDHRFRIPIMGVSILLQMLGYKPLLKAFKKQNRASFGRLFGN